MKSTPRNRPLLAAGSTLILLLILILSSADAQTKKKKHVRPRPTTSTQKSRTASATSEPGVVSRADDYQESSTEIIQPGQSTAIQQQAVPVPAEDANTRRLKDIQSRVKRLEAGQKNNDDDKQKRLALNLDILTKAEERVESLRKQRFELIDKENVTRTRLDQIDIEIRPEMIERRAATEGSLRPEELREARRKSLDSERRNLQSLLDELVSTRSGLEQSIQRAEDLVEKLRTKLDKDIDDAIAPDRPDN